MSGWEESKVFSVEAEEEFNEECCKVVRVELFFVGWCLNRGWNHEVVSLDG